MKLPKHIEHWDDERSIGNSIIVMIAYGLSFEPNEHEGVRGFDTVAEARGATALKELYVCDCADCVIHCFDTDNERGTIQ